MMEFRPTLPLDDAVAIQAREAADEQAFEEFLVIYERRRKERALNPDLPVAPEVERVLVKLMIGELEFCFSQMPVYPYNLL